MRHTYGIAELAGCLCKLAFETAPAKVEAPFTLRTTASVIVALLPLFLYPPPIATVPLKVEASSIVAAAFTLRDPASVIVAPVPPLVYTTNRHCEAEGCNSIYHCAPFALRTPASVLVALVTPCVCVLHQS